VTIRAITGILILCFFLSPFLQESSKKAEVSESRGEKVVPALREILAELEEEFRLLSHLRQKGESGQSTRDIARVNAEPERYERALELCRNFIGDAENTGSPGRAAFAFFQIADTYGSLNQFKQALVNYHKALDIFERIGNNGQVVAICNSIGYTYITLGNFTRSHGYFLKALHLVEQSDDIRARSRTLNYVGIVNFKLNNIDTAYEYFSRSLELRKKRGDESGIAANLNNIGEIYKIRGDYQKALECYTRALQINEKLQIDGDISVCYNNIGEIHNLLEQDRRAKECYGKSLEIARATGSVFLTTYPLLNLSVTFRKTGQLEKALAHAKECLHIAEEIDAKGRLQASHRELASIYETMGDYGNAFFHLNKFKSINNEIFNRSNSAVIAELQTLHEIGKRENKIEILRRKDEIQQLEINKHKNFLRFYLIVGGLILTIAFVYYFLYRYKKRTETSIHESERKYRNVVERAREGIAIIQDEVFRYVNPEFAKMVDYPPGELLGASVGKIVPPDQKERITENYFRRLKGESIRNIYETELLDSKNNRVEVEVSAGVISYESKPAMIAFFRNIGKKTQLEAERLKRKKLESIGLLAGGIAHDFNNILGVLMGNLEISKRHIDSGEKLKLSLAKVESASLKAMDLARQFLTFSDGGVPVIRNESLAPLLREAVKTAFADHRGGDLQEPAGGEWVLPEPGMGRKPSTQKGTKLSKGVTERLAKAVNIDIPIDLPPVKCESEQLKQALGGLLINAMEAMEDRVGNISINVESIRLEAQESQFLQPGIYVKLTIIDQGVGISAANLGKIFDPYFSTKRRVRKSGLGLGLAIVNSIIKHHSGHVEVASQEGEGTSVTLYLPAAEV
ncbi:MAG: tetratricopeptide repeat protein, partial [bacterium]|nr:tetratricopeptide repeat protein [bacterium]